MFLNPWAISMGAAALFAPFFIHWLTRPRPTRVPLSTLRFVREIVQQRRARSRLRDLLILLLRATAVALVALAVARPVSDTRLASPPGAQSGTRRVVLLDISQSMAAAARGILPIERARPLAARHVDSAANDLTNLILCAAQPLAVFEQPSSSHSPLLDEAAKARVLPQRLQVQPALNLAAKMLADATDETSRLELVVISDFQRSNWASADFSVVPSAAEIRLESVAHEQVPPNLAILRVRTQSRVEQGRPFRLEVELGNYTPVAREVAVDVSLGARQFRLQGTATPGARSTLVTEAVLPNEGWIVGEARLVGVEDALKDDDRRAVAIEVHRRPNYLLVTRQPADAKAVSSYYLERAIAPQSGREQLDDARVVRIDPLRLTSQDLESSDLLLFDHPGKLSEDLLRQTSNLLQRGRGLLYVAAEPIDATNLMLLSKAAAGNLKLPVAFQPPPSGQPRSNLSLVDMRLRDPPFSVFGEEAPALFSAVRFHGGLATRRVKGTLIDDVLATYNDQSACLVATPCGAGLLVVLNTDLAQSTLAASPAFVPLIGELTSQLLGRDAAREAFASGEPIAVYLPPSASPVMGLVVEPQSGRALEPDVAGELREEAVGVLWQAPRAGPPGAYEIKRNGTPVFAAATAIPAEEADLSSLPADLLTDRLGGGRDVKYRSALRRDDPRDTGWVWLAIGCLTCLFGELIGLRLFRS